MKLILMCLLFFNTTFIFAEPVVLQLNETVKDFLIKIASKEETGYDINNIEDRKSIRKLFRKDSPKDVSIYAKFLLETENKELNNEKEKSLAEELLKRTVGSAFAYSKEFKLSLSREAVITIEKGFRENIQRIDPMYH